MGGAQKAVLWPALPVHLCAHGNGRRQQEERKELEDCERTEKERRRRLCPPIICPLIFCCLLVAFLPISLFYSHVRGRKEGTGEEEEKALVRLYLCHLPILPWSVVYSAQSCQTLRDTFCG